MRRTLCGLTLIVAQLCGNPAFSSDLPTVYGIQLGGTLTLPNCSEALSEISHGYRKIKEACYEVKLESLPEWLSVQFPMEEMPDLPNGNEISLMVRDNIVHRIGWGTRGVYDSAPVIEALRKKFGKPTSAKRAKIRDEKGIEYDEWVMEWVRPSYVVIYETINFARLLNTGTVAAYTHEEYVRRMAKENSRRKL